MFPFGRNFAGLLDGGLNNKVSTSAISSAVSFSRWLYFGY